MANLKPDVRFAGFESEWEKKNFGSEFTFLANNTLSRDNLSYEYGETFDVHYGDILIKFGEYLDVKKERLPRILNQDEADKYKMSLLKDGDIIIADTAEDETVGKCTEIYDSDGVNILSGLHTIPCRPLNKYASKYLGYCMNSPKYHDKLFPLMQGIKVSSISKNSISETEIVVSTSLDEQKMIGEYLSNLDSVISKENLKLEKMIVLKNTMLARLFPKKEEDSPIVRFNKFTKPWKKDKLSDLLLILKDGTHGTHQDSLKGPLLLSAKNIKNGKILWDETDRHISVEDFNKIHSTFSLKSGDVLLTIVGSIGEAAILKNPSNITFQRSVAFLRPGNNVIPEFLYAEIQTTIFQKELENRKSTSAQPGIYLGDLAEIPIYYPEDKEEQKIIGEYIQNIEKYISLQQAKCEKLGNIKLACMKKMFV